MPARRRTNAFSRKHANAWLGVDRREQKQSEKDRRRRRSGHSDVSIRDGRIRRKVRNRRFVRSFFAIVAAANMERRGAESVGELMHIYAFKIRTIDDAIVVVVSSENVHEAYEHSIILAATCGFAFYDVAIPRTFCFGRDEVDDNVKRAAAFADQWERSGYTVVCTGAVAEE